MKSDVFENVILRLKQELDNTQAARANLAAKIPPEEYKFALGCRIAREFLVRGDVDSACRKWIKNRTWPEPKNIPEVVLDYWDRIYEGYHFGSWIYANSFVPPPEMTESELLEFLLIQHWAEIGVQRKKAHHADLP